MKQDKISKIVKVMDAWTDNDFHLLSTWREIINHYNLNNGRLTNNHQYFSNNKSLGTFFGMMKRKGYRIEHISSLLFKKYRYVKGGRYGKS